jgi:hypothetical protein
MAYLILRGREIFATDVLLRKLQEAARAGQKSEPDVLYSFDANRPEAEFEEYLDGIIGEGSVLPYEIANSKECAQWNAAGTVRKLGRA